LKSIDYLIDHWAMHNPVSNGKNKEMNKEIWKNPK